MRIEEPSTQVIVGRRTLLSAGALLMITGTGLAQTVSAPAALAALERRHGGRLGVYALDVQTGRSLHYRADEAFKLMSSFKGLPSALVLSDVAKGRDSLDAAVRYGAADLMSASPVTQANVARGSMSVREMCEAIMYRSDNAAANLLMRRAGGPAIFDQSPLRGPLAGLRTRLRSPGRKARGVATAKYEAIELRRALEEVFGDRRIGDSVTRLVIPAYDGLLGGPYVFKTAHHPRFKVDHERLAVDAALATAAAPSYLPAHAFEGASHLLDGGVWANNPMGSAALEGATALRWDMERARMLSLGCTDSVHPAREVIGLKDVKWLVELLFRGQDRFSQATAKLLLGHPHVNEHMVRVNPVVEPGFASLDDASKIETLMRMGRAAARAELPRLESCFFIGMREPFVPFHKNEEHRDAACQPR